jgi:hypothetical protein
MDTTEFTADFALLHPAGHLTYSHRGPGESIAGAIRRHLPNLRSCWLIPDQSPISSVDEARSGLKIGLRHTTSIMCTYFRTRLRG